MFRNNTFQQRCYDKHQQGQKWLVTSTSTSAKTVEQLILFLILTVHLLMKYEERVVVYLEVLCLKKFKKLIDRIIDTRELTHKAGIKK
jgi:hypothetical protein